MNRPPDYRHSDLFGGSGEVLVWDLPESSLPGPFTAVLACRLAPGGSVGPHRQEHFPEVVIVTHGVGTVEVDGVRGSLAPGTVVPLPLGSSLALTNTSSDTPLDYLIVKAES